MADAPEVYQAVPQGSPTAAHSGPYFSGPRPEAEGLQVHNAYDDNYNKAPYSDNPALGPQGQQQYYPPQQQQYASPPLGQQQQYASPPLGQPQQGQYIPPPLGPQGQYAASQPGDYQPAPPYAVEASPQPDEKAGKKRICGLSVVVFWCLIVAAVLIVVGAVVGGVVGSQKAKDSKGSGASADTGASSSSTTGVASVTTGPSATTSSATTSASASATPVFDEDTFYSLSNQFLGSDYAVSIRTDNGTLSRKLNMTLSGAEDTAQLWQIKAVPDADGRFWFASAYLGKGFRMFLDGADRVDPVMAAADDALTGQQWSVKKVLDGTWRIGNVIGEAGAQVSTYSDTYELFMDLEDDSGTKWSIGEVRKITAADGIL
ncbi:hypothetical protein VE03_07549 [Pseudogymnoascus sp. 23342-1-I1]|nr:hypothetical protein VE03_07549 [Pseudogymnoascus sp. 23342-1-I1]